MSASRNQPDPADLAFFQGLFTSIAEEMGVTLARTAYSPNIKERKDFSCAVFDGEGRLVAQAAHIPVHLGALPLSVQAVRKAFPSLACGDTVILNDPYQGGTHLPDITLVSAWMPRGNKKPFAYLVTRAHHADVGGIAPGSLPVAEHIEEEGVVIPPTLLVRKGRIIKSTEAMLTRPSRTPMERRGDLRAQLASHRTGERRLAEAADNVGITTLQEQVDQLIRYGRRSMASLLRSLPTGNFRFEDGLDDDGFSDQPLPIRVSITITSRSALVDFTGTARQCRGSLNAVRAVTQSAVYYCFLALMHTMKKQAGHADLPPLNAGCLSLIRFKLPAASLVNARYPAAVAGGNVETSQRIVDCVLGALAQAVPDIVPAASQGTMNNLTLGGVDPRTGQPFAYYETTGGGSGASSIIRGESGIQVHMTNTLNTPVEALEYAYPFRVLSYGIADRTGGQGAKNGGNGIHRSLELLAEAEGTLLTDRRKAGPYGLAGGRPGKPGKNELVRRGRRQPLPGKQQLHLEKGDVLNIRTPGGGGFGRP